MEKIRSLRKEKGMSQQQLATKIGVSRSTVAMWEVGSTHPDQETLRALSSIFGVSIDYMLSNDKHRRSKRFIRVPVLGTVPAGVPVEAIEDSGEWEELGEEYMDGRDYVGIKVKGSSMEPTYLDGDVLIVALQETADTGDDAIIFVNGEDATFKRIRRALNGVYLQPLNPDYDPMFYTNHEIEELPIRIFGVAVEIRRKLR